MTAWKSAVVLLLVCTLCHQPSLAQVDPWERIRLIEPGKNVSVKLNSGKTVKGKMEAWNSDGLSVKQGKNKSVPMAKSDVARVALVTGMSRGRKAAYAGLIAGGITGGITGAACASDGCFVHPGGAIVAIVGVFWGGVSAGIAALFPQHNEVIYTAAP